MTRAVQPALAPDENEPIAKGRNFPNFIKAYMRHSSSSEAPDVLHFWTAVATVAGALGRKVWIDELKFKWTPNFYVIFVAPPGIATKSTSVDLGMALLQKVEGVVFGPDSMTWQGLTIALTDAAQVVEFPDFFLRHSSITCAVGELGTFLKTKDEELLNVLTDLWDCKRRPWRHRTKTGENPVTEIVNPWINVIGCTTPSWLRKNFSSDVIEGGLTSRCIFVYVKEKRRLVPYPSMEINSNAFYEMEELLGQDLQRIALLQGQYQLTPEARVWGVNWYNEHWGGTPPSDIGDRYSGYLARKQTHIHKLAIVLAAAQRDNLLIEASDLGAAERFITGIEVETQSLLKRIGATNSARQTQDILEFILGVGGAGEQEIWRLFMSYMTHREMEECLTGLMASGHIIRVTDHNGEARFLPVSGEM